MILDFIANIFLSKIAILFIDAIALYLAFLVFRDDPKGRMNRLYIVMTFLMLTWVNFAYIPRFISQDNITISLYFLKVAWIATPLFFTLLYMMTMSIIRREEKFIRLSAITITLGTVSALITGFTNKIVEGIDFVDNIFTIIYGPWMIPFLGVITFIIIATLYPVFKEKVLGSKRVRYFLFGVIIFYIANAIFNIGLPVFFGVARFYFLGDYSTILLLAYTAVGIIRYNLFDIKTIAAEMLTFSIWLILLAKIITTNNLNDSRADIFILVLTVIFGVLLIRSVKKEVEHTQELEKLTHQLKVANSKLRKLDEAKSEFISIASHQLRTPLTVIKGYLSMIKEGDFGKMGKKIEDPIEKIFESSQRLISLVANLLNISRIESGRLKFNFAEIQLEDMIESVMDELKNKAEEKGLKFTFKKHKKLFPKTRIDEEKIRQVIANIIDNSIKYTETGSIEIELNQEDNNLYFCARDTGAGIKKNDIGKLFQKFSRGTGKTKTTDGTGLGLFVARQMVEAHKGSIWVESKGEGHGCKFCFTIPIKNNLKSTV